MSPHATDLRFSFEREYWLVVIRVVVPRNAQSFRKSPTSFRNQEVDMAETDRLKYLRVALLLMGVILIIALASRSRTEVSSGSPFGPVLCTV